MEDDFETIRVANLTRNPTALDSEPGAEGSRLILADGFGLLDRLPLSARILHLVDPAAPSSLDLVKRWVISSGSVRDALDS